MYSKFAIILYVWYEENIANTATTRYRWIKKFLFSKLFANKQEKLVLIFPTKNWQIFHFFANYMRINIWVMIMHQRMIWSFMCAKQKSEKYVPEITWLFRNKCTAKIHLFVNNLPVSAFYPQNIDTSHSLRTEYFAIIWRKIFFVYFPGMYRSVPRKIKKFNKFDSPRSSIFFFTLH